MRRGRRMTTGVWVWTMALAGCVVAPPRGTVPKYATGVASYWTAVGVDGDAAEALVNEEGMVEIAAGRVSLEPFVEIGDRLVTWADVTCVPSLVDGDLPMPVVTWRHPAFTLTITVLADGRPGRSEAWVRYELAPNAVEGPEPRLRVAVRPRQVLPPWQTLNVQGGDGRIEHAALVDGVLEVDGRRVRSAPRPLALDPAPWRSGRAERVRLLGWPVGTRTVDVVAGLYDGPVTQPTPGDGERVRARVRAAWRERLGRVSIRLPQAAGDVAAAVRATLGWILVDRDGAAIRPGPRNYARSWIRDGAVTSVALLMLAHPAEVNAYLRWYASFQLPDGRVPCCVDDRGADPTPENDSDGELIYAVAEYWRFTKDRRLVEDLWPTVRRAARHILALRSERIGSGFAGTSVAGLVPESISHEGYAARAVHSYWDDFFALRGLGDAAVLARVMGESEEAEQWAAAHDAFGRDLSSSVARVIQDRGLAYVPGSVELADFDPTSTAIAVTLAGATEWLPADVLGATFTRYTDEVKEWTAGAPNRDAFTPYEARNADALVRLGRREEAAAVLTFIMGGRRPVEWHVWPEVVATNAGAPRFLGDMPHAWGGATVVQAVRTMLAYEREEDDALVLAAGVPSGWLDDGDPVVVRGLPTHWGPLGYEVRRTGPRGLRAHVDGGLRMPAGGVVLAPPVRGALVGVRVNGRPVSASDDGTVRLRELPATVEMEERG